MKSHLVPAEDFFRLLYEDAEFCANVGKVVLAAGMLETNLRRYLQERAVSGIRLNTTLGGMVKRLKECGLLSKNGVLHFEDLALKRNYLAHSIHDLFSRTIAATILPRENLTEIDVRYFVEKAEQLAKDFVTFSTLVAKANVKSRLLL